MDLYRPDAQHEVGRRAQRWLRVCLADLLCVEDHAPSLQTSGRGGIRGDAACQRVDLEESDGGDWASIQMDLAFPIPFFPLAIRASLRGHMA